MAAKMMIEGLDNIIKNINQIGNQKDYIIEKALKKAIIVIHDDMPKRINKSYIHHDHLKDNIPINEIKTKGTIKSISTGFEKSDNSDFFYAKMLEWGTVKMNARPFMQPSYNNMKEKAFDVACNSIKEDLGI